MDREAIYLEQDEDITTAIEKMSEAKGEKVSLVVPKRLSLMQSAVNLKLLERSAERANKDIALITSDKTIESIAAKVGIKIASNLKTEPEVPELVTPEEDIPPATIQQGEDAELPEPELDEKTESKPGKNKTKLAGMSAAANKKIRIPDFDRFKKRLLIGGGVIILLALLGWVMTYLLPGANVKIYARTSKMPVEFDFTASASAEGVDLDKKILPVESKEVTKTLTDSFTPSGEKKIGEKATGEVTVSNCSESENFTVPAGTTFTASSGEKFVSTSSTEVPGAIFSAGSCSDPGKATAPVAAAELGDKYNLAPTTYSVQGYPGLDASGGQMSGGSEKTVKVVTESDITKTKTELLNQDKTKTKQELTSQFGEEYLILEESFNQEVAESSSEPPAGEEAEQARVIIKVSYYIFGVKKDDILALLKSVEQNQLQEKSDQLAVMDEAWKMQTIP